MEADVLRERAAAIKWWHGGMDLGQGVVSQGTIQPAQCTLPYLALPADLTGVTVLDVGTWDGFYAFECERRNAQRVVAVDSYVWNQPDIGRSGFDLAHEARRSKVEAVECDVLDLLPENLGVFDLVLFLGVIYHMRHPLLALERVAAMVAPKGMMILEGHAGLQDLRVPAMRFYPGSELNNDPTNWWGPNSACISAMLRDVGFTRMQQVGAYGDRVVFHAYR